MKLLTVLGISLAMIAALVAGMNAAQAAPATNVTYLVNSTDDLPDLDTLTPACLTISNTCTLRAAIQQANYSHGPATITVPSGTYLLSRQGFDDDATAGDLDILTDVTIQGAGSTQTFIDDNIFLGDRIFDVLPQAIAVTLTGLSVSNGNMSINEGGGIRRTTSNSGEQPSLVLSDVIVANNIANFGGGLYADGGSLTLDNVTLSGNRAQHGGGGFFGNGITLTVRNSRIYSNTSGDAGGGLSLFLSNWRIAQSDIYSNTAIDGGGIYNSFGYSVLVLGPALVDSNLRANHAQRGGALASNSTLLVARSQFVSNTADTLGGALYISYTDSSGSLRFNESTFNGNAADDGGAIYVADACGPCGTLILRNNTLSGNVAKRGGAIEASDGAKLALYNSTIAYNEVFRLIIQHFSALGGGLLITSTAQVTTQNSLIGQNHFNDAILPRPDDCYGPLYSLGYNLIQTTTQCLIGGTTFGNITSQDPRLGPLQNNGGTTWTHALLPGSPAIDAGDITHCKAENGAVVGIDQRGFARPYPQGGRCDIGAFERGPYLYLPLVRR